MPDRRTFLGGVSSAAALSGALVAARAGAQTAPSPTPSPSASPAPPSAESIAAAAAMRRFDPALSAQEIEQIARGIETNHAAGTRLNPNRGTALANGDEPVTRFVTGQRG